jgi:hypothetical protein
MYSATVSTTYSTTTEKGPRFGTWGSREAFAVEDLQCPESDAVRLGEAIGRSERLHCGQLDRDACADALGVAEAGEGRFSGFLGVTSQEPAGAVKLAGELIKDGRLVHQPVGDELVGDPLGGRHDARPDRA